VTLGFMASVIMPPRLWNDGAPEEPHVSAQYHPSSSPLEDSMSIIPEPLRSHIEAAAHLSPDMNIPNNDDPIDDPTVEDESDGQ
jgi:hypothetical protein